MTRAEATAKLDELHRSLLQRARARRQRLWFDRATLHRAWLRALLCDGAFAGWEDGAYVLRADRAWTRVTGLQPCNGRSTDWGAIPPFVRAVRCRRSGGALSGVLVEANGTAVGCDNHRLHVADTALRPAGDRLIFQSDRTGRSSEEYPDWRQALCPRAAVPERITVRDVLARIRIACAIAANNDERERYVPLSLLGAFAAKITNLGIDPNYLRASLVGAQVADLSLHTEEPIPRLRVDRPDGSFAIICLTRR